MWLMLSDCFLSIVSKDCKPSELLVRARRKGDIEKLFRLAKVVRVSHADYRFRAVVKRTEIIAALTTEVTRIDYPNFKDSVDDDRLHDAYMRVWTAMAELQGRASSDGQLTLLPPVLPEVHVDVGVGAEAEKRLISVDELELTVRVAAALKYADIKTIGDLLRFTPAQLLRIPNFGNASLWQLSEAVAAYGLRIGEDA